MLLTPEGRDDTDSWSLRQLMQSLALDSRTARPLVEVISFADDPAALTVGPRLAGFAASSGTVTRLEVEGGSATQKLRAACSSFNRSGKPATLQLGSGGGTNGDSPAWRGQPAPPCKLTIRCLVTARGEPAVMRSNADANLLVLSPGIATADDVAAVALRLDERGERIDGTIVVNPDPTDDTAGVPRHRTSAVHTEEDPERRLDRETATSSEREP